MIVITYPWAQKYRPHHTISSRRTCPIVQVAGPKLSLVVRCSKPLHPGMVPPRTCYTITSFYACAGGTNAAAGTPSRVTRGGVKGHKADLRCQCIWTGVRFCPSFVSGQKHRLADFCPNGRPRASLGTQRYSEDVCAVPTRWDNCERRILSNGGTRRLAPITSYIMWRSQVLCQQLPCHLPPLHKSSSTTWLTTSIQILRRFRNARWSPSHGSQVLASTCSPISISTQGIM
jgi:hypothetical protein